MFSHEHYVPILKAKGGEFMALEELETNRRKVMTPLLDIPNVAWNHQEERYKKTLREHLRSVVQRISETWTDESAVFIDLDRLDPALVEGATPHPVIATIEALRREDVEAIPVTAPTRDDDYERAVSETADAHDSGVCVRLSGETLSPDTLEAKLSSMTDALSVTRDKVDLILDFGPLEPHQKGIVRTAAKGIITNLPHPSDWRTITFAGTAFPKDMSPFEPDSLNAVERIEWTIWKDLVGGDDLQRHPAFGDYTVNHPAELDVDPRLITMAAKLRYTREDDWLIYRGRDVIQYNYEQRNDFAADLITRADFRGEDYSAGDAFNYPRGTGQEKRPGSATQWLFADINHHLAVVADQIASLSAS